MTSRKIQSSVRDVRLIGAALLIAAAPMLAVVYSGHGNWLGAFIAATVVAILSAVCSMIVIGFGLRDARLLPAAALGATLVRATISLLGGVIAVLQFAAPAPPTLLMILGYYLALLIAEFAILWCGLNPVKEL